MHCQAAAAAPTTTTTTAAAVSGRVREAAEAQQEGANALIHAA
jgi:hypothetical protein